MTFLNPLVLLGLAAAAIPVILHLLNLRKLRTIEFSTLRFLKELQQTKIRRLKLRQLLLLIIRTLLVILTVLAFARPALRGSFIGGGGAHAHTSVVIIFDDSFSMKASDENGERFRQAKEIAARLVAMLADGDEAFLIKMSDLPQATVDPATHDFRALRTLIDEANIADIRRPMEDALRLSARLLTHSKNANKEVYIISDFQKTLFPENPAGLKAAAAPFFDETVKLFTATVGGKTVPNTAVDSVEVRTAIVEFNKRCEVYASVRNFGDSPLRNYVVSAFLDSVRVAQTNVQIPAWGSTSVNFSVTPKKYGFSTGYIELENDAIEQDNCRYFTLFVPKQVKVAVVANSAAESHFALLALASGGGAEESSLLAVQQIAPSRIASVDLNSLDVLVLVGCKGMSPGTSERIEEYVRRGGGLVLFPGSDFQTADFNGEMLPRLSIPPVEALVGNVAGGQTTFQGVDFDHPLFASVFEGGRNVKGNEQRSVESPLVQKFIKRKTGGRGRTIIGLSEGSPFLSDYTLGEGRILLYSVAPVVAWSDFPLKGLFVPLVYRSVLYVSSRDESRRSVVVGDDIAVDLQSQRRGQLKSRYALASPDAVEEFVRPESAASRLRNSTTAGAPRAFLTIHSRESGFYTIKDEKDVVSIIASNVDARESDGRRIARDELIDFWGGFGIQSSSVRILGRPDEIQTMVMQSRFGTELWKYCIALALLLAFAEMYVARDTRKETSTLLHAGAGE